MPQHRLCIVCLCVYRWPRAFRFTLFGSITYENFHLNVAMLLDLRFRQLHWQFTQILSFDRIIIATGIFTWTSEMRVDVDKNTTKIGIGPTGYTNKSAQQCECMKLHHVDVQCMKITKYNSGTFATNWLFTYTYTYSSCNRFDIQWSLHNSVCYQRNAISIYTKAMKSKLKVSSCYSQMALCSGVSNINGTLSSFQCNAKQCNTSNQQISLHAFSFALAFSTHLFCMLHFVLLVSAFTFLISFHGKVFFLHYFHLPLSCVAIANSSTLPCIHLRSRNILFLKKLKKNFISFIRCG